MSGFATRVDVGFAGFAVTPLWTVTLPQNAAGGWTYIMIENETDKRLDISFDGTNEHSSIDAGFFIIFDFTPEAAQGGSVYLRGETTDPTSGSVLVSGRTR